MSSLAAAVAVGDSTVTLYRVLLYWKDGEDDLSICLMSDNLLRILTLCIIAALYKLYYHTRVTEKYIYIFSGWLSSVFSYFPTPLTISRGVLPDPTPLKQT
jgi:hypothetical protein